MNSDEDRASPYAQDWNAIEARFRCAKRALLEAQQLHRDAAHEYLLARAQVRLMLEAVFPGVEADARRPASVACPDRNEAPMQQ